MIAVVMFLIIILLLLLGLPIAWALGATSLGFIACLSDLPLSVLLQKMYNGVNSFPLLAIPLFMLAGSLMNHGGISRRLVDFSLALVGHIKGGLSMVTIVTSMFFGAITGTCAGASAAVGQILIPSMVEEGYPKGMAAAVTSAGASLGIIIPPSVPMILYSSIASISVGTLFMGGLPLGVMIGVCLMIVSYFKIKSLIKKGLYHDKQVKFSIRRLGKTFLRAIPALCIPVIILGGIMSGVVSPTESAALAVFAGLLIGGLVYRELTWRNIWASVVESVKSSATVMIIVATATILGYAFTVLGVSRQIMQPLLLIADTQVKLMLITSLILFIGGFFLDGTVMVLVLVPLFMPAMQAMAIDPLQFAMLVIVVWCIGQQTPPVASGLYVTCALAKVGMIEASKYNLTYLAVFVVFALGLIFIPDVVLYLPRLFIGQG